MCKYKTSLKAAISPTTGTYVRNSARLSVQSLENKNNQGSVEMKRIRLTIYVTVCMVIMSVMASSAFPMTPEEIKILGHMENGRYTNESLGLTVYFSPEKWDTMTEEKILSLRGITLPSSTDIGALEKAVKYNLPVFMVIQKKSGALNVNLTLTDIGMLGELVSHQPTFIEGFLRGLSGKISRSMQNMQLDDFSVEVSETSSFLNSKRPCIYTKSTYRNVPMYQKVVALSSGRYVYQITVTTLYLDKTDDVLAMFAKTGE